MNVIRFKAPICSIYSLSHVSMKVSAGLRLRVSVLRVTKRDTVQDECWQHGRVIAFFSSITVCGLCCWWMFLTVRAWISGQSKNCCHVRLTFTISPQRFIFEQGPQKNNTVLTPTYQYWNSDILQNTHSFLFCLFCLFFHCWWMPYSPYFFAMVTFLSTTVGYRHTHLPVSADENWKLSKMWGFYCIFHQGEGEFLLS